MSRRALRPGRLHRTAFLRLEAVKQRLLFLWQPSRHASLLVPFLAPQAAVACPKVYFESGDMLADDFRFGAHERVVKEILFEYSDDPKKPHTLHG
jgi:hypothetical protein